MSDELSPTTYRMLRFFELARKASDKTRGYLGMSEAGNECEAKVWLNFLFATERKYPVKTVLKFDDGNISEAITANRLRFDPNITLITLDERTGGQFAVSDFGGHLGGHLDGLIKGTVQLGDSFAVWENKCVEQKEFNKLRRLKEEHGKAALIMWSKLYYTQAQLYMHYTGYRHHFLTVATSGSRDYLEVVTDYDQTYAVGQVERAGNLIASDKFPERINTRNTFPCNTCTNQGICFNHEAPLPTCRSCLFSQPILSGEDATWVCHKKQITLSLEAQMAGCDEHLYNPEMLKFSAVQIDCTHNTVTYESNKDFRIFINGNGPGQLTSLEVYRTFLNEEHE